MMTVIGGLAVAAAINNSRNIIRGLKKSDFASSTRRFRTRLAGGVLGGLLLAVSPALWAEESCPCGSSCSGEAAAADDKAFSLDSLLGDAVPFTIGGWTQLGYTNDSDGVFNTSPDEINLHEQWLYAERVADGRCGWDFGFRLDAIYGTDAQNTQAFGEPPPQHHFDTEWDYGIHGWALPQVYVEVANGDWSVKGGHFLTLIGYESVPATVNFFFSRPFTFNFNEPFTHTGVLGTYTASDAVTLYGGWTAGWDTGFDSFDGGNNFLGGVGFGLSDRVTVTYALTAGDLGFPQGEGYSHSLVVDTTPAPDWNYVFQWDQVEVNANPFGPNTNHRSGVVNYLFYTINNAFKAGVRAEWFRSGSHSVYEITTGVNVRPIPNLVIRPEFRWQFADGQDDEQFFANQLGIPTGGTIFGIDVILTY
ncbi:MAG: porin [Nitrococcus sp.]|nr:porin [Nitrococcus sp.]